VAMFVSCGGVGQAGVGAVRRTLQLYKSLMRPASLKNTLVEQHKYQPPPRIFPLLICAARTLPRLTIMRRCEMSAIAQRIQEGETLQLMMMWTAQKASNL
jgi:hypothetical protein